MGLKFREHWFGLSLAVLVLIFLVFVGLIAVAPHNDRQMRGFTPCTYEMGVKLSQSSAERQLWGVMTSVVDGYVCYAKVIGDGVKKWSKGEQGTPWANYLFEADTFEISPEESEPYSEDLLKANRLDDEDENVWQQENAVKENENAKE